MKRRPNSSIFYPEIENIEEENCFGTHFEKYTKQGVFLLKKSNSFFIFETAWITKLSILISGTIRTELRKELKTLSKIILISYGK